MSEEDQSKPITILEYMIKLGEKLTALSAGRSEMSEVRSYHNAERTLAVWVRTALTLMLVGLAIDRFGLLFHHGTHTAAEISSAHAALLDTASTWICVALIGLGVLMALATGSRFVAYARTWSKLHQFPAHHGPYLATFFAFAAALFGIVLLVIILLSAE